MILQFVNFCNLNDELNIISRCGQKSAGYFKNFGKFIEKRYYCALFSHPDICYVLWPQTILPFIADEYHYSAHCEISRISRPNNDLMGQNRDDRSGNSRDNSL